MESVTEEALKEQAPLKHTIERLAQIKCAEMIFTEQFLCCQKSE